MACDENRGLGKFVTIGMIEGKRVKEGQRLTCRKDLEEKLNLKVEVNGVRWNQRQHLKGHRSI